MVDRETQDASASDAKVANIEREPALESVLGAHALSTPALVRPGSKPDIGGVQAKSKQLRKSRSRPTAVQKRYLERGLEQPGGKLPLFDDQGQEIDVRTIKACVEKGWAEPWFANPMKPSWLVCKLTDQGRKLFPRD